VERIDILIPLNPEAMERLTSRISDNTAYYLENTYIPDNKIKALERAFENEKLPIGIFHKEKGRNTFEDKCSF